MHEISDGLKSRLDDNLVSNDYGLRRKRRQQVVSMYGGFAPIIPIYAIAYGGLAQHGRANVGIAIASLALILVCFGFFAYGFYALLRNTYVNAPNLADDQLDERWISRRNLAVLRAFRCIAIALLCVALYIEIALTAKWSWMRDPYLITWMAWLGSLAGFTLPTAIMAWNEPDPLVD